MNLFFLDSERNLGGVERWMLTAADHLRRREHTIHFSGREGSRFLDRCKEDGFSTLPLRIRSDISLGNVLRLSRFFREKKIDVIVTNLNKDTRLAGMARHLAGRPPLVGRNGLPILPDNWLYRTTYRHLADGVIVPSDHIRDVYSEYGWLPEDFVRVIHNGIDGMTSVDFNRKAVLKKHGLPDQEPVIGIFGRMVPQKQHTLFLDIAQNVIEEWPEAIFLIAGDGPLYDNIRDYASRLGIISQVYMLGFQAEVLPLYSICNLVLHTSEHEGLPNAVLEAMFCARPVVAFDSGGTRELISSPRLGVLVPPHDIYVMTQKVLELLMNPEMCAAIGRSARAHILKHFTVEKMVDKVEAYFMELCGKRGS